MRTAPALLVGTALVAALAGCAAGDTPAVDGCTMQGGSTATAGLVTASGPVGTAPEIDFPTPLVTAGSERVTLVEGEGQAIPVGAQVVFDATLLLGATGQGLEATGYDGEAVARGVAEGEQVLYSALACARVGERFVVTSSVAEALEPGAYASVGIPDEATLVIVYDIVDAFLAKADGVNQLPLDGMPTVTTAVDGTPGITIGSATAPAETRSSTIKLGDGARLEAGDEAVLHRTEWSWAPDGTALVSQTSWGGVAPALVLDEATAPAVYFDALVGATVGSQLLVVTPAETEGGAATILVLDVLGVSR